MAQTVCVVLNAADRSRLEAIASDRNRPRKYVDRARVVLASVGGRPAQQVAREAEVSRPMVWRWQRRFAEAGPNGLLRDKTRKPGKPPIPPETVARVVALTCVKPPPETTHLTGRAMAKIAGISLRSVQRIWDAHQLQPHRVRSFKALARSALRRENGRYRRPLPRSAGSHGGAVDRREEPNPGAGSHSAGAAAEARPLRHDDTRLQAPRPTTLFAAPNVMEGTVIGRCMQRHRHPEFIRFLNTVEREVPTGKMIEAIVDNYATHKHPKVKALAGAPSALDLPLHADVRLLVECGGDVLLGADPPAHPARQLPLHRQPAGRHQSLPR
jgi:hypothetical protein